MSFIKAMAYTIHTQNISPFFAHTPSIPWCKEDPVNIKHKRKQGANFSSDISLILEVMVVFLEGSPELNIQPPHPPPSFCVLFFSLKPHWFEHVTCFTYLRHPRAHPHLGAPRISRAMDRTKCKCANGPEQEPQGSLARWSVTAGPEE